MTSNGAGGGEEEVPLRSLALSNEEPRLRANSGDDVLTSSSVSNNVTVRPAISCTSLNDGQANKPRPQFLRKISYILFSRDNSIMSSDVIGCIQIHVIMFRLQP